MLMNILPGLRELRAPLASGYLWLIALWIGLGHAGWLPAERPPGDGEVARLWDLGGVLGKTVVLAAVSFVAYLIGSFLEMDPAGQTASILSRFVVYRRALYYSERLQEYMESHPEYRSKEDQTPAARMVDAYTLKWKSRVVTQSLSPDARSYLRDLLEQRGRLPDLKEVRRRGVSSKEEDDAVIEQELDADFIIADIINEVPQLALRLLVSNKELYGKYDKHMAEADVRINVALPLTLVLILTTALSGFPLWLKGMLTLAVLGFGFMLLRQGLLRIVSARDVIAQALSIDQVRSRHIPAGDQPDAPPQTPADSKEHTSTHLVAPDP